MTPAEKKMCIDLIKCTEGYCQICAYYDTEKCPWTEYGNLAPCVDVPCPEVDDELCLEGIIKFYENEMLEEQTNE